MKRLLYIFLAAGLLVLPGCSDDDNDLSAELTGPLYGLQKGDPGSADEMIYNIWEDCGVYYLYRYDRDAFLVSNWSSSFSYGYTPVKDSDTEAVRQAVGNLHTKVFAGMDGDFIRRNWFVRVFLCDELTNSSDRKVTDNYVENGDALVIPNVNGKMLEMTDAEWDKWTGTFSDLLISRLYLGAPVQPVEFFALRPKKPNGTDLTYILTSDWIVDPDGRYSKNVYTFRSKGYIRSRANSFQTETINIVYEKDDVADYINFMTKSTKEEMDWCWAHFPAMKERAHVLIPYLTDVLGLNLESMQNANVPDDAVPAGYFSGV